jgi:hypothetical protein
MLGKRLDEKVRFALDEKVRFRLNKRETRRRSRPTALLLLDSILSTALVEPRSRSRKATNRLGCRPLREPSGKLDAFSMVLLLNGFEYAIVERKVQIVLNARAGGTSLRLSFLQFTRSH